MTDDPDFIAIIDELSADALHGLLWQGDLTDSTRKELQRHGLFYPLSADKTPLGKDVLTYLRAIEAAS